jgi:6,7-dimethyl-8-ribityllumazine synthase
MSGAGAPSLSVPRADGLRVTIVASQWHDVVMQGLIDGALRILRAAGVVDPRVIRVPGAFELPLAAQAAAPSCDALVALGVVIRGGTPHFDYVCGAATKGLLRVSLDAGRPLGFGLLTCDTESQALDRAGLPGSTEDKGAEATLAAISMVATMQDLVTRGKQ